MKPYIVTVKYLVKEARDPSDAVHRASQWQLCRAYHEVVEELDCNVEFARAELRDMVNLNELTDPDDNPAMLLPGERVIDGQIYYSADWL